MRSFSSSNSAELQAFFFIGPHRKCLQDKVITFCVSWELMAPFEVLHVFQQANDCWLL